MVWGQYILRRVVERGSRTWTAGNTPWPRNATCIRSRSRYCRKRAFAASVEVWLCRSSAEASSASLLTCTGEATASLPPPPEQQLPMFYGLRRAVSRQMGKRRALTCRNFAQNFGVWAVETCFISQTRFLHTWHRCQGSRTLVHTRSSEYTYRVRASPYTALLHLPLAKPCSPPRCSYTKQKSA